jgi:hypothetical protein
VSAAHQKSSAVESSLYKSESLKRGRTLNIVVGASKSTTTSLKARDKSMGGGCGRRRAIWAGLGHLVEGGGLCLKTKTASFKQWCA